MSLKLLKFDKFLLSISHTIFVCIKMPLLLFTIYKFLLAFCHVIFGCILCV